MTIAEAQNLPTRQLVEELFNILFLVPPEERYLRYRLVEGMSLYQISKELNVSYTTISRIAVSVNSKLSLVSFNKETLSLEV